MEYRNSFDQNLPYRIVEVIVKDKIMYKITQQKNHWLFGLSKKYYDVVEHIVKPYVSYKRMLYFSNKEQIDNFIKQNTFTIMRRETIVFDSKTP